LLGLHVLCRFNSSVGSLGGSISLSITAWARAAASAWAALGTAINLREFTGGIWRGNLTLVGEDLTDHVTLGVGGCGEQKCNDVSVFHVILIL